MFGVRLALYPSRGEDENPAKYWVTKVSIEGLCACAAGLGYASGLWRQILSVLTLGAISPVPVNGQGAMLTLVMTALVLGTLLLSWLEHLERVRGTPLGAPTPPDGSRAR